MLVNSKNKPKDDKDWLAIGQKEFYETNPFGYKDYKETKDQHGWWKNVEYTDEKGEKVVKDINALGQVLIHQTVNIRENYCEKNQKNDKKVINLDDVLSDDWSFDDIEEEKNDENHYNWEDTPEVIDEMNLTEKQFNKMDWRKTQYLIYRLLLDINSSLSYIKDVANQKDK